MLRLVHTDDEFTTLPHAAPAHDLAQLPTAAHLAPDHGVVLANLHQNSFLEVRARF